MASSPARGAPDRPDPSGRLWAGARTQERHLRRLVRHAWHASPFYRACYEAHGIRAADLDALTARDLPFVTKQTLMERFDEVATDLRIRKAPIERWLDANRDPRSVFDPDFVLVTSSGSSGLLGVFVYDRAGWATMNALAAPRLPAPEPRQAGKPRVAFVLLAAGHTSAIVSSLEMPRTRFDALRVSLLDPLPSAIEALNAFQPDRLVGYASAVTALAEAALAGRLHIRPRQVLATSEPLTPAMERAIRAAWDAPIHVLYAASESIYVAIRDPGAADFAVLDEVNLVEVLDGADREVAAGGEGRVVLTNLHNHALPIIRYELGDTVVAGARGPNGSLTAIRDIRGRVLEPLPVRRLDGTVDQLHPLVPTTFYVPGVTRIQFVSRGPEALRVDYVSAEPRDNAVVREARRVLALQDALGTAVSARRVAELPTDSRTGKTPSMRIEVAAPRDPSPARPAVRAERRLGPTVDFEPFPRAALARPLTARLEEIAARAPDHPAVLDASGVLTYAELNRRANRVARAILARDPSGAGPVAVLADHGAATVVAMLGALKARKVFVPLDPTFPPARLAGMLDDTQAVLALVSARHAALAESVGRAPAIDLAAAAGEGADADLGLPLPPAAPAYVLYTSGSTGEPRGVVHSHEGVLHNVLRYVQGTHLSAADRMTMLLSFSFSAGMTNAFPPLLVGATLCAYDLREQGLAGLADFLDRHEITIYKSVPTTFRHFCEALPPARSFPRIRMVELAGEPVTTADVERFTRHFAPPCLLHNRLGAAETHIVRHYFVGHDTPLGDGLVPVGYEVADTEALVLDEQGRRLGPGQPGEVAIRSRYLAVGYWRQPDLTRAAFVPDPGPGDLDPARAPRIYRTGDLGRLREDGCLELHGRVDAQLKVRGQRLDGNEVERALLRASAAIAEAAVVVREDRPGEGRLVAYLAAREREGQRRPAVAELRRALAASLPTYMVPSEFVWLAALPLTPTGKVDRLALPLPQPAAPSAETDAAGTPPRTSLEARLAMIWADVLRVEHVGVHDDFLDAGGDSLAAMRVIVHIRDALGVELSPRAFFESGTIAALAGVVADLARDRPPDGLGAATAARADRHSDGAGTSGP